MHGYQCLSPEWKWKTGLKVGVLNIIFLLPGELDQDQPQSFQYENVDNTSLGKYSHDYSVIYGEEIAWFYDVTDYIVFTGASKKITCANYIII